MRASRRFLRRTATIAVVAAGLVLLGLSGGCDGNRSSFLLDPSGRIPTPPLPATGVLTGSLDFGTPGDHPASLVLLAPIVDPGCVSSFNTIQVVGTPTGYNIGASPHLTQLSPCFWADTLSLPAGALGWKFVTNGAFDSPPDYGKLGSQTDGLVGVADLDVPGPDGDMKANVPSAGVYLCQLDETFGTGRASYSFVPIAQCTLATFSSAADGRFTLRNLRPGSYNVLVRTPGALKDTLIANLAIGSGTTDLGTLYLGGPVATGSVSGSVDYAGPNGFADLASAPYPPTTVVLKQGLTTVATVNTGRAVNTFSFPSVPPGTYEIVVDAPVFQPLTKSGIVVAAGPATDAGSFQLVKTNLEISNFINAAGDFNGWSVNDPMWELGQTALGVWQLTSPSTITAGDKFMKFVTDQNFDVPPDYGGDETTIAVPVTNAVTYKVTGSGTAIKLSFPADGIYTFTLDERRQTFSVAAGPAPARPARRSRP